jgi:iron complex outermembrane receptor protein
MSILRGLAWQALALGCAVLSMADRPASAQAAHGNPASPAPGEIVVTAQRREELPRTVPIAITTIGADDARDRGILGTTDIPSIAPGVTFNRSGNVANPFIRGVGAGFAGLGYEPSVAVYLDDLYIPQASAVLFENNGLESISVLRGPQGTLYGRNATGGVIQVRTRDPSPEPRLELEAGYASYDTVAANLYATARVAAGLSANLAAYVIDQDEGWGRNLVTGDEAFAAKDHGVRLKLLWEPADGTRVLLSLSRNYRKSQLGLGTKPVPGSSFRSALAEIAAADPASVPPGGFYDVYASPVNDENATRHRIASLRLEQSLGWATMVSISGWQDVRSRYIFNQEGSPGALVFANVRQQGKNHTQEFQLLSPDSSAVRWIAGAYYYWDKAAFDPLQLRGASLGYPDALGPDMLVVDSAVTSRSFALYGQASAALIRRLNFTLGLRYSGDRRRATGGQATVVGGVVTPITSTLPGRTASWGELTWRAAVDYRFARDAMVYASYNRGHKSGLFNLLGFAQPGLDPDYPDGRSRSARPIAPEKLDAYEVGAKLPLANGAARLSAAAFFYQFRNIQVAQIEQGALRTVNAGAADILGIELEAEGSVTRHLTLTASLSVLNGEYTAFPAGPRWTNNTQAVPQLITVEDDLTGNETIHTPPFTLALSSEYEVPTELGDIGLNLSYYYNDGFFWEPDNSVSQPSYHLLNASLGWRTPDGRIEVNIWARNLLNQKYFSWANATAFGALYSPGAPRTFGLRLGYRVGG